MYLAVGLSVAFFCVCLVCNVTECPDRTLVFHYGIFLGSALTASLMWIFSVPVCDEPDDKTDDDETDDETDDDDDDNDDNGGGNGGGGNALTRSLTTISTVIITTLTKKYAKIIANI